MSTDRERLAAAVEEALDAAYHYSSYRWPQQQDCPRIADALLPVMDRIANERAAAELRAVAHRLDDGEFSDHRSAAARSAILACADALDPT